MGSRALPSAVTGRTGGRVVVHGGGSRREDFLGWDGFRGKFDRIFLRFFMRGERLPGIRRVVLGSLFPLEPAVLLAFDELRPDGKHATARVMRP